MEPSIIAALLSRAHLLNSVNGFPFDDTIFDIPSSGFGASCWKQLNFKSHTASLQDVDCTSTVFTSLSASYYAVEAQEALVAQQVRRFVLVLGHDVPCILDSADQQVEYIDLPPGAHAFHPEFRGSVKGSAYQDIVRGLFFNFNIGTFSSCPVNGRNFICTVPEPIPLSGCHSFSPRII
jgi:hypothetical protein